MLICQKSPQTVLISSPRALLVFYPLWDGLMVADRTLDGLGLRQH